MDTSNDALLSQVKLLRRAVKVRNEYMAKLESALKDLEFARAPVVFDEITRQSAIAMRFDSHPILPLV